MSLAVKKLKVMTMLWCTDDDVDLSEHGMKYVCVKTSSPLIFVEEFHSILLLGRRCTICETYS